VFARIGVPILFFLVTMASTTAVGMRYMYNFRLGSPPLTSDDDILPYAWVLQHLAEFGLVGILLAHEFGHYFACRRFNIRCSLPYLLPAPSLSGTFGAVIRLRSVVRSRAALIVIGAAGPLAGFLVALVTITLGLGWSTYSAVPLRHKVQAPVVVMAIHALLGSAHPLTLIIPHPVLIASWIGLLITALNLIPAGQLDGGHILYALSPGFHRWSSRVVIATLAVLGVFYWMGWIIWAIILMLPGMRHPRVDDPIALTPGQTALLPVCLAIFLGSGTFAPFQGYGLLDILPKVVRAVQGS
jgi:Zn-dependent protease